MAPKKPSKPSGDAEETCSGSGYGSEISEASEISDAETSGATSSSASTSSAKTKKKKPKGKRCSACNCNKRLSIVTEYLCRCGQWYCTTHRYPETHECEFDYKEHGRKMISEANPVVVASKIQKI